MSLVQIYPPDPKGGGEHTEKVDVVAVHGLNPKNKPAAKHAEDTWTGPKSSFWLRDELPTKLPQSRIFIYKYDSTAVYGKNRETFIDKANAFLERLRVKRSDDPHRPLLLLGHSLGGLLIKQALINAFNNQKYKDIKRASRALAFFAVPHHGGDRTVINIGSLAEGIARTLGFQEGGSLLATLREGGIFSDIMQEHWKHRLLEYHIVSFWGTRDQIVTRASSTFGLPGDIENLVGLQADHSTVCKFGPSEEDQDNLELVLANVQDLYKVLLEEGEREDEKDGPSQSQHLDSEQRRKKIEWLQKLYCPYRDHKDRNPSRVEGTCDWFTNHPLFQQWRQSTAASLWVSADPGCGKSVLAKYLVDEVLPSTTTRTTCYFFFKEDFETQRSSVTALCCILHQLFIHSPAFFSSQILEKFEHRGPTLLTSFGDLWDILISATTSHGHQKREVVCIFDALDECEKTERNQLIDAINNFSPQIATGHQPLKFLLTSRPYVDIERRFRAECQLPTIHLSGENEEETAKICSEIDIVIKSRAMGIIRVLKLGPNEQNVLIEELSQIPNRTYLWVHLIFEELLNSTLLTPNKIRSEIRNIPRTVSDAYERILSKSQYPHRTRKLLHIIIAAAKPLTLPEMALALMISPDHQSISDLELVSEDRFKNDIRQLCGLFVIIVDSKVYLLHQTAREYLVSLSESSPPLTSQWQCSFYPRESHRVLAEICIRRLSLSDFDLIRFRASTDQDQYLKTHTFLKYSAQNWADHFREANWNSDDNWAVEKAILYCHPNLPTSMWFEIYRKFSIREIPSYDTPLLVAAYFGLNRVVERLPKKGLKGVDLEDRTFGRSAISWAAGGGHVTVLQQLLCDSAIRPFLGPSANVNIKDNGGESPLHLASRGGRDTVVQQLLAAGADVDIKDLSGMTPLHWVSWHGRDTVVQQLLAAGADIDIKDCGGTTPLHLASWRGRDTVVQQLLAAGADIDIKDCDGETPLHLASRGGRDTVVQQLLAAGADIGIKDCDGKTPLHLASRRGHDTVVQQLLAAGADVSIKDHRNSYYTSVQELRVAAVYERTVMASRDGHDMILQKFTDSGPTM